MVGEGEMKVKLNAHIYPNDECLDTYIYSGGKQAGKRYKYLKANKIIELSKDEYRVENDEDVIMIEDKPEAI
jgi:hypothetical protein